MNEVSDTTHRATALNFAVASYGPAGNHTAVLAAANTYLAFLKAEPLPESAEAPKAARGRPKAATVSDAPMTASASALAAPVVAPTTPAGPASTAAIAATASAPAGDANAAVTLGAAKALKALASSGPAGREKALKILADNGVTQMTQIPIAKLPAFQAACEAALAPPAAAADPLAGLL